MEIKKQLEFIRHDLILRIRSAVSKKDGCIGTYFKNNGKRLSDPSYDGAAEYGHCLNVCIDDTESLSPSPHETMTVMELFIRSGDNELCCVLKPDGGACFDAAIDMIITDSLLRIVEWLVEQGFLAWEEDVVLYCSECGSTEVGITAWVRANEGKMFYADFGANDDDEYNRCDHCGERVQLFDREQMVSHVNDWWEEADTDLREKVTGISFARFDAGEIPAFEAACDASWNALDDDQKIATWQKWKASPSAWVKKDDTPDSELMEKIQTHLRNLRWLDQHNELSLIFMDEQKRHKIDMQPWIDEWHACECSFAAWYAKLPSEIQTRAIEYYRNLLKS